MDIHDAGGLLVPGARRFKQSNFKIPINCNIEKIDVLQSTRQIGIFILLTVSGPCTSQIIWITVNAVHVMRPYLPNAKVGITAVIDA